MSNSQHIMRMSGDCTIAGATAQHEAMLAQWADLSQQDLSSGLCVDLSGVTDCDSAGVQLLLSLKRSSIEAAAQLSLHAPSDAVKAALRTYNLSHLDLSHLGPNPGAKA